MLIRTYSDLRGLSTLEERFDYLRLAGVVAEQTFGLERYLNQRFYHSSEWRHARDIVIARDYGFDLGSNIPIVGQPRVHHMNPLTIEDIELGTENLLDPEFLISCSLRTHNAVHYGDESQLPRDFVERTPGDTRLWG